MLIQLLPDLYVGDMFACSKGIARPGHSVLTVPHATIHAVKDPCYREMVGKVPPSHPQYLRWEDGHDLYLNMIDAGLQFFRPALFQLANDFIHKHVGHMPIVIHCNRGESRAPALAMVYAASMQPPPTTFETYLRWLENVHPFADLSPGLALYLSQHWNEVVNGRDLRIEATQEN